MSKNIFLNSCSASQKTLFEEVSSFLDQQNKELIQRGNTELNLLSRKAQKMLNKIPSEKEEKILQKIPIKDNENYYTLFVQANKTVSSLKPIKGSSFTIKVQEAWHDLFNEESSEENSVSDEFEADSVKEYDILEELKKKDLDNDDLDDEDKYGKHLEDYIKQFDESLKKLEPPLKK